VRTCVYLECANRSNADVSCADGSQANDSPEGRPGCCGEQTAAINDYDCGFGSKDADIWISVGVDGEACVDYALEYEF